MHSTRRGTARLNALDRPDIPALAMALAMERAPDVSGRADSSSRCVEHKHAAPGSATTAAQEAAPLFRALAEPTRLAILLTLQDGERRITDLAAELGGQVRISSHMTVLKDCGLITGRSRLLSDTTSARSTTPTSLRTDSSPRPAHAEPSWRSLFA